jgi:hypothetical protein
VNTSPQLEPSHYHLDAYIKQLWLKEDKFKLIMASSPGARLPWLLLLAGKYA